MAVALLRANGWNEQTVCCTWMGELDGRGGVVDWLLSDGLLGCAVAWSRKYCTLRCATGYPTQTAPACHPPAFAAGGWLGRAFLGQGQFKDGAALSADTLGSADSEPHPAVRAVVTLGTPHTPPPADKARVQGAHGCLVAGVCCLR